jgi:hypothetical protein
MKILKNLTVVILVFTNFSMASIQTKPTLNGKWKLICFHDFETNIQDCKPANDPSRYITLTFTDDGVEGTLDGHTTTNKVSGVYKLFSENKIQIEKFGGTKMGESGWGGAMFWRTIRQSSSFTYNSDTLVTYYDNNTKAMKFINAEK